jgi:hypothetical protein
MPKLTEQDRKIWEAGRSISNGFGLWGSLSLSPTEGPGGEKKQSVLVKAWIDGLRERGYSDADIVFLGDWKLGRWYYDSTAGSGVFDYAKAKAYVLKMRDVPPRDELFDENSDVYPHDFERIKTEFGEGPED